MSATQRTINVYYDPAPMPSRSFDWHATLDTYDGGDISPDVRSRDPVGHGATAVDAQVDLLNQLDDMEAQA